MTYGTFKTHLNALLLSDRTKGDDALLLPLLRQALNAVAIECFALSLVSDDSADDILIALNKEGQFIRVPLLPENDDDFIDIDESLCLAVVNVVASYIAKDKSVMVKCLARANEFMHNYRWTLYRAMESDDV